MGRRTMMAALAAVLLGASSASFAATPNFVPYQGRLTDASGTPLSGVQTVVFSFYTVALGGSAVYSETQTVAASNGLFTAQLGTGTPITGSWSVDIFDNSALFLGIKVGSDAEMTPRVDLGIVPFSARSAVEPGLSLARIGNSFVTLTGSSAGAADQVQSTTITIPASGYIYIIGHAMFSESSGAAPGTCYSYATLGESGDAGFDATYSVFGGTGTAANTNFIYVPFTLQRVYQKSAGTYTFVMRAYKVAAAMSSFVWDATMTAIFIPEAMGSISAPASPRAVVVPARPQE